MVIGSIGNMMYAKSIGGIFQGNIDNNQITIFIVGIMLSFFLLLGQNYFSKIISNLLEAFSLNEAVLKYSNYSRERQVNSIANMSSEIGRLQGIMGNALSLVISYSIFGIIFVANVIYKKEFTFLLFCISFIPVLFIIQKISKYFSTKYGIDNRKYSSLTNEKAVSLNKYPETHIASNNIKFRLESYASSVYSWIDTIRKLWFLNITGKFFIELIALSFGVLVIYYDKSFIDNVIILARLIPGVSAYNQFKNGSKFNLELYNRFLYFLRKNNSETHIDYIGIKDQFNVNSISKKVFQLDNGFYLLTGKSGSGKSTALKNISLDCKINDKSYLYVDSNYNDLFCVGDLLDLNILKEKRNINFINDIELNNGYNELSNGQKQRLIIASIISLKTIPEILILDEIISGLDEINKLNVLNHLKIISKNHKIITVDHELANSLELTWVKKIDITT